MKKRIAALLAMLMITTTALAAEAPTTPSYGGRSEGELFEELIVGTPTSISGNFFSDTWGTNSADFDIRQLLHGYSLVDWDADMSAFSVNQTVVGGLVSEVDEATGDKTYIIALVDGLTYSDGSPIQTKDYVFSILLNLSPAMNELGGMASRMNYIVGAPDFLAGNSQILTGVRLIGDKSFSITVSGAFLPFFYEMGLLAVNPYPIQIIAPGCQVVDDGQGVCIQNDVEHEQEEPIFTAELLQQTLLDPATGYMTHPPITSGAYTLASYDAEKQEARLDINPYYIGDHEGRTPTIERLVFRSVVPEDMVSQLVDGTLDLLNKCTEADTITRGLGLRQTGDFSMGQYTRSGFSFVSFACEQGPTQYQEVRQAVALCFDRDQFITDYVENYGTKVNGYYGMGQWMTRLVNGTLPAPLPELSENPTAQETAEYDAAAEAWDALTLEHLDEYGLDLAKAEKLLVENGWIFNEENNLYDPEVDIVRAKTIGEELMLLELELMVPAELGKEDAFLGLQENLAKIGVRLTITPTPYIDMMRLYYRQEERACDMFFLGTNFMMMFDPTRVYSIYDEDQGALNTTGLRDEGLMDLAMDMYKTEPGDILAYVQKWVAFQTYWNEALPAIPLYSNVYFDFYTTRLHDYYIDQHTTWGEASLYAYLSEPEDAVTTLEGELEEDGLGRQAVPVADDAAMGGTPLGGEEIFMD